MKLLCTTASLPIAVAISSLVICAFAAPGDSDFGKASNSFTSSKAVVLKGRYIVEFEDAADMRTSSFSKRARDQHHAFHEHLSKRDGGAVEYQTMYEFADADIFVGLSLDLKDASQVSAIHSAPGVKAVHPVEMFRRAGSDGVQASAEAVKATSQQDTFAPHVMTQVDRLHEAGHFGKDIKVAVIDTGVDYTHPALNGGLPAGQPCFGRPECQIVGGFDLVGSNFTGKNAVPSPDPFADCPGAEHGQHVAGILVANDTKLGFTGVSPQAKLLAYRIYGCDQGEQEAKTATDVIVAAMTQAVSDGAQILSLSLGGPSGFANSPTSLVASRIAAKGVPVIVSAGNDGDAGAFYSTNPASAEFGISVASVQNTVLLGYTAKVTGIANLTEIFLLAPISFEFAPGESRTLSLYYTDNACSLPADLDLASKLVVTVRGSCATARKQREVLSKGGKYFVIAVSRPPISTLYAAALNEQQQAAALGRSDTLALRAAFMAGNDVKVTFEANATFENRPNKQDGGLLTSFTSFGPTHEMLFAPHIGAPGGNILSTYPVALGSYGIISGSSMSAPFIAGIVAQYLSIKGKTPSVEIRSRLMAHSKPVAEVIDAGSMLASVGRSGAGLVQAWDSIFASASAEPAFLTLNDSANFQGGHLITIKNTGQGVERYTTTHLPAGTAQTVNLTLPDYPIFNHFPVLITNDFAGVAVSPTSFTLAPNESKQVKVSITQPKLDQNALPVYSGFINFVASTASSSVSIAYLGLSASLAERSTIDSSSRYFGDLALPALTDRNAEAFPPGELVFDLSNTTSQPFVVFRLLMSTPYLDVSLVPANTTFVPTINRDGATRRSLVEPELRLARRCSSSHSSLQPRSLDDRLSAAYTSNFSVAKRQSPSANPVLFSDVPTNGSINGGVYQPRNLELPDSQYSTRVTTDALAPDGSAIVITEGHYRVLLRVQRTATDARLSASYDSWLSEAFTYRKAS